MPRPPLALFAALLVACDFTGTPAVDLAASTDHPSYEAASPNAPTPIRLVLENTGREPLEIGRCRAHLSVAVDRLVDSRWQEVAPYATLCLAAYDMSPLQLAPGAIITTDPMFVGSGRYRFRVPYGPVGGPADAQLAVSN